VGKINALFLFFTFYGIEGKGIFCFDLLTIKKTASIDTAKIEAAQKIELVG
jgi:hypothetical protein